LRSIGAILVLFTIHGIVLGQQFPSDYWHTGKLVITEGDTLRGSIKYDYSRDLVQIEVENHIYTFGAKKILFFEIFDVTVDSYREFYSVPFDVSPGYKAPILFEVLYEGRLTLLCRESVAQQTSNYNNYYWSGGAYTRNVLEYHYYFLTPDGNIIEFTEKKKDLLDLMKDRAREIKSYIKTYNLKVDKRGDLARITAYYNSLEES